MAEHTTCTEFIANSLARSKVFSYICGGDTEAALDHLGFEHKLFNHVSTGGGAVMEYLVNGSLPGQRAIEDSQKEFEWEELLEFVA